MAQRRARDFSIQAFQAALDADRLARGLSWTEVAHEIAARSGDGRASIVSASTLRSLAGRTTLEGDGVLQLLSWLNRTPESFVAGEPGDPPIDEPLPPIEPGRVLRFDAAAIHRALDLQRTERGVTWQQVAREIGDCNASQLTRLSDGGRVAFPLVMRVVGWLGRSAASFTRSSAR